MSDWLKWEENIQIFLNAIKQLGGEVDDCLIKPPDCVWHNKLGFMEVGKGDYIAFDLLVPNDPPVVYLSHDDGQGHGFILGHNFIDFMNRWTRIGCVGREGWQMFPFLEGPNTGIMPDSENAIKWRDYLKVSLG